MQMKQPKRILLHIFLMLLMRHVCAQQISSLANSSNQTTEYIADTDVIVLPPPPAPENPQNVNVEEVNKEEVKDVDASEKTENKTDENLMPVFSEWTQQMQQIQEAEKKLVESNSNSSDLNKKESKNETTQSKQTQVKNRLKNYASSADCGAKILSSSPESQSTSSVLNDKDEYMLSPCTEKIWFVIELCEAIQASKVELANTELFSSPLKEVTISVSNRYPTREWTTLGRYQTKSERDLQVFEFVSSIFGKFVRVDLTYTNSEHFCPLSYFRIYGTSEIEAFEVDNEPVAENNADNDVEDEIESTGKSKVNNNLLNRAGAAVMQMVAKAAEALSKNGNGNSTRNLIKADINTTNCISLSYEIICLQCSNDDRKQMEILLTCKDPILNKLLDENVKNYLIVSTVCSETLGSNLKSNNITRSKQNFLTSILPTRYLAAMCHLVAKEQKTLASNKNIQSSLDTQPDELSLKNVSKSENDDCKKETENNPPLTPPPFKEIKPNEAFGALKSSDNINGSKENESNIFNVSNDINSEKVEQKKEDSENKVQIEIAEGVEVTTPPSFTAEADLQSGPAEQTQKPVKQENGDQLKIPQQISSTNHPESVFLRLSNRIKTLEKNMTLSTQYLEELSKRYKKQIEELQQAFTKLQSSIDQEISKGIERDGKSDEMKTSVHKNFAYLNERSHLVEITVGVLVLVIIVQMFIIFMIYRHVSLLTKKFESIRPYLEKQASTVQITSKKRQRNRVRKISAPNILSQKYSSSKNDGMYNNVLRTSSVPKMHLAESLEDKENLDQDLQDINMQRSLEENDEILIPGFEDLNLKDSESTSETTVEDDGLKLKHRMSLDDQSTLFHPRNNSLNLDNRRKQKVLLHKKALSESPPPFHQKSLAEHTTNTSSQSLRPTAPENGNIVTFKKSNSLKKLFKKIF